MKIPYVTRIGATAIAAAVAALVLGGPVYAADHGGFPAGKYLDGFGNIITFSVDGKFSIERVFVQDGQYTIDGDVITMNESELCPPVDGVYNWNYDADAGILQFEEVEDGCSIRDLTEPLTRLP